MPDVKSTYEMLRAKGANVGDFNGFKVRIKNPELQKKVYGRLSEIGAIDESYEDFSASLSTSDRDTGKQLPTVQDRKSTRLNSSH